MIVGAVDVGGTKIAVGLVRDGKVIARRETPTAKNRSYAVGLENIRGLLQETLEETGAQLAGIGIGLTGRMESGTRKIGRNDVLPDWQGRDLAADLAALFQVTADIANDADAAALAEAAWGVGRGQRRFIYVTVSTGIGGGVVLDGRLYTGVMGSHPEIGHHTIDPQGPACYCGGHGCWESLASGTAMLKWAQANLAEAAAIPGLDVRAICDLAEQGAGWAVQVVQREGRLLGVGLANLVNVFAPDQIALGGGVMRRWNLFAPYALPVVRERCRLVPAEHVCIAPAQLGDDTPLLGAGQVWLQAQA